MKSITFGYLLDKLLYLSRQKKTALAKTLGYDISYISKWTSGKNLPIPKNINSICEMTSKFIVNSTAQEDIKNIKEYFEINENLNSKKELEVYLEELLRESYAYTAKKSVSIKTKEVYWEDDCNSVIHVNPRLRKPYLDKEIEKYINKSNKLNLILCANLNKLCENDKISIADIKKELFSKYNNVEPKVKIMLGFDGDNDDIVFNTIMIINMISIHPNMDFEIYNCQVDSNSIISVVRDLVLYTANFTKDKRCLLSTTSMDKSAVEDMYYSLETILKNQGNPIFEKKKLINIIKEKTYTQYFMTQDLRWLIGSISELFMPPDLFMEVANSLFDDSKMLEEISKINIVLQNITYKSKIKVLIYVSELKKYISSGKIKFFNKSIELDFEQRKKHINYLKNIILNNPNIEIKLVDGDFVEYFKDNKNTSLYLSKNVKLIQTDYDDKTSDYVIIKDKEFKKMCDIFYKNIWEEDRDIIIDDKDEIIDILEKELTYVSIINENF